MEKEVLTKPIDWGKHHRFMPRKGLCGPTTIWMVLSACGIRVPLWKITKKVYKNWYGTPSVLLIALLKQYFSGVNYKIGASIADIAFHKKLNHILIVNFWDGDERDGDGHYAIISDYEKGFLTLVDSSREHDWQWSISTKEFRKKWYDLLTEDGELYHTGLLIWILPFSKRVK
jgi:hypothetical protein